MLTSLPAIIVSKMESHNKTLHLIASKLGLVDENKVLGKAAEFERLLQTKSIAGSYMTDTSKVVICLDLAAGLFGADIDVKMAIKYSGLKPSMYTNSKKIIQNLLDLDSDKLTTCVLCAALQCTGVQSLADQILDEYKKQAKMEIDLNLPQYVCMAVFHACRISKVKVPKSKVIQKSRLKPAQWAKLDEDWAKFVDTHFPAAKQKRSRPVKIVESNVEPDAMEIEYSHKETTEPQIEPYDEWKRRMLETAHRELELLEEKEKSELNQFSHESFSPRRSPRKTPQKFSPYKSPTKVKGIRLLFRFDV